MHPFTLLFHGLAAAAATANAAVGTKTAQAGVAMLLLPEPELRHYRKGEGPLTTRRLVPVVGEDIGTEMGRLGTSLWWIASTNENLKDIDSKMLGMTPSEIVSLEKLLDPMMKVLGESRLKHEQLKQLVAAHQRGVPSQHLQQLAMHIQMTQHDLQVLIDVREMLELPLMELLTPIIARGDLKPLPT